MCTLRRPYLRARQERCKWCASLVALEGRARGEAVFWVGVHRIWGAGRGLAPCRCGGCWLRSAWDRGARWPTSLMSSGSGVAGTSPFTSLRWPPGAPVLMRCGVRGEGSFWSGADVAQIGADVWSRLIAEVHQRLLCCTSVTSSAPYGTATGYRRQWHTKLNGTSRQIRPIAPSPSAANSGRA